MSRFILAFARHKFLKQFSRGPERAADWRVMHSFFFHICFNNILTIDQTQFHNVMYENRKKKIVFAILQWNFGLMAIWKFLYPATAIFRVSICRQSETKLYYHLIPFWAFFPVDCGRVCPASILARNVPSYRT